ncbi:MAG TPA: glycoside hydrolase family 3 N-terminal domain-containing protein [Dictyobacter sp.]|nr:glycoside hydrolase family 3 N-terminal domain-containing protein [Dictyobacter sp.]
MGSVTPKPRQKTPDHIDQLDTARLPGYIPQSTQPETRRSHSHKQLFLYFYLLCLITIHPFYMDGTQFLGTQGWANILAQNTAATKVHNLLSNIPPGTDRHNKTEKIVVKQAIEHIVNQMSLDQKIGQMLMIQFVGPTFSLPLSTMINQYYIGSVLLFSANGNIENKSQLTELTQQMQQDSKQNNAGLPVSIAIDQEGGAVDRLRQLDGTRPAEAVLGASNDPNKAREAGQQDARNLSSYGITLNLAPVVDVDSQPDSELHRDQRTYGETPAIVTSMANAYLQGLQQSGKVVGTLKHFPGLGSVVVDPHFGIPSLTRTQNELENIDWKPYRDLIHTGRVHAIMVTHELVPAIENTLPSSLSPTIVHHILRDEMGFKGVIMTDSLTMTGITSYYTPSQAAVLAIKAGSDMIMGTSTPDEVATTIASIKQAINTGILTQNRIDMSVRRILFLKYQMGLLPMLKHQFMHYTH